MAVGFANVLTICSFGTVLVLLDYM